MADEVEVKQGLDPRYRLDSPIATHRPRRREQAPRFGLRYREAADLSSRPEASWTGTRQRASTNIPEKDCAYIMGSAGIGEDTD